MNQGNAKRSVLIAASGSGGHLMPARLIAEALLERGVAVHFVGSGRPLEEEIFGPLDIPLHTVCIEGINNRGVFGLLKFALNLPRGYFQTRRVLSESSADAVIGVGGYASVLPVILGSFQKLPTWIHEAELSPGNANKLLARFTDHISLAFEEATGFPEQKTVFTGHPVRPDVAALAGTSPARETPQHLLVLGGSQGARALDEGVTGLAPFLKEHGISVWHQCRPENVDEVRGKYLEAEIDAQVMPFIHNLGEAYEWSDLIICRAGAGTVMEVGMVNRPAIFVPFPHAQGLHQHKNAKTLVDAGKALLVDELEPEFPVRLAEALKSLSKPSKFQEMIKAAGPVRPSNAAQVIADRVLERIS